MISVMMIAYQRQDMIDITIPCWLKQEGVDFEIVVGTGPGIQTPIHPRVRAIPLENPRPEYGNDLNTFFCCANNQVLAACKGDIILMTQSDIQASSPTQLKRMLELLTPNSRVTELFIKDGKRDFGNFIQCCLIHKKNLLAIGGWPEVYDRPDVMANEDGDMVCSLFENGIRTHRICTPEEDGVYHIWHIIPDYESKEMRIAVNKGGEILRSRHKESVMYWVTKQSMEDAQELLKHV